jgi:hypothetical protein
MTIVGKWYLFWDWKCMGKYARTEIIFEPNGIFRILQYNQTGKWVETPGMVLWNFDTPNTRTSYGGTIAGHVMHGIMGDFNVSPLVRGCWYATKEGVKEAIDEQPESDPAGKKM